MTFEFLPVLLVTNAFVLGLFVGSMLTEAMILVPYWRSMEPSVFLQLHGTLGPQLYRYFAPLTIAATVIPLVTAVACRLTGQENRGFALGTAGLMLGILGIYFFYFKAANESFKTGSVGIDGLAAELRRWAAWHGLRTVISSIAFGLSLMVLLTS